ncbi:MAG: 2-oxoacid:ferredoxin oxidoreductase subunit beta [Candidatus Lokiarchaeota archaeon]|nr:2-oxoacid:ferredoxin oxidoreductase subunit beta [Candidatus Lokiarchaeota archaeon]
MTGRMAGIPLHYFCKGCGYGSIGQAMCRVFDEEKLDPLLYPFIVNVGCYSQIPGILPGYSFMALHGRGISVATGLKMSNPELKPISIHGDGDLVSIGTNHFIHGCRRNIDMVVILLNNKVYGMTGGQVAPTTPTGYFATTSPYGYEEEPIDAVKLAIASGATYVARWTTATMRDFIKSVKKAIKHKGFSFVEIVSQCVTYFGRKNKMSDSVALFKYIRDNSVKIDKAKNMSDEDLKGKWVIGEHLETQRPTLWDKKSEIIESLRRK